MIRSMLFLGVSVLSMSSLGCVHREVIREEPSYHAQKREEHREIKQERREEHREEFH